MINIDQELLKELQRLIKKSTLIVSEDQANQLVAYVQMMDKWNKAYNLTSVRNPNEMLLKHIMDSIVVAPLLHGKHYIDVGTGPGLPGIPLSIMLPDCHFILLDSLGKRVRFMKQVAYELKLTNIEPVQSRVEAYKSQTKIDGVLSRAFASLKDMLHWCQHLVDSEGKFLALKGQYPAEEIEQLSDGFVLEESHLLNVPELEAERHLIILNKNN